MESDYQSKNFGEKKAADLLKVGSHATSYLRRVLSANRDKIRLRLAV
jgi:hypothetical protein